MTDLRKLADIKPGDACVRIYRRMGPRASSVCPATVKTVGRKYITIDDGTKFSRDTGYGEFGWTLYGDEQAFRAELEAERLGQVIASHLTSGARTESVDLLRQVAVLLKIDTSEVSCG